MAEDQGVNGDRWTVEASKLFERLGWEKFADSNIDLDGKDGLRHGIDSIFVYEDGFNPKAKQVVFLEAKRYHTNSFSKNKINDWITVIDKKLRSIVESSDFYDQYPKLQGQNINAGILTVWFHNHREYYQHQDKIQEYLREVKVPRGQSGSAMNRLFYLDNAGILKMCSMIDAIDKWNLENESEITNCKLQFHYPSSTLTGYPVQENEIVNLEYIFSKFVLCKSNEIVDGEVREADVIFYFGPINKLSYFYRLREALLKFDMISNQNNLYLYLYEDDDEFRKIEPEVIKELSIEGPPSVYIRSMNNHSNLPEWLRNQS